MVSFKSNKRRNRFGTSFSRGKRNNNNNGKMTTTIRKGPIAISTTTKLPKPVMVNKSNRTIVKHTEFVTDVQSPNDAFNVVKLSINPGLSGPFPWLSSVAARYEYYEFLDLKYLYKPICPTTTPGTVMMAVDFDASDPTPTSKPILMAYSGAQRISPWDQLSLHVSKQNLRAFTKERFTRIAGAVTDIKTYDVGNFYIATSNTPSTNTNLGELYVEYTVALRAPQIGNSQVSITPSQSGTIALRNVDLLTTDRLLSSVPDALMWVSSFKSLENLNVATFVIQGLSSPMLFNLKSDGAWGFGGDIFNRVKLFKDTVDYWIKPGTSDYFGVPTNGSAYRGANENTTNTAMDVNFIIGGDSYAGDSSRNQYPFTISWPHAGVTAGIDDFAAGTFLRYSLTPISQALVDTNTDRLPSSYAGKLTTDWLWPNLKAPYLRPALNPSDGYSLTQTFTSPYQYNK